MLYLNILPSNSKSMTALVQLHSRLTYVKFSFSDSRSRRIFSSIPVLTIVILGWFANGFWKFVRNQSMMFVLDLHMIDGDYCLQATLVAVSMRCPLTFAFLLLEDPFSGCKFTSNRITKP